jgi:hypothetical protein
VQIIACVCLRLLERNWKRAYCWGGEKDVELQWQWSPVLVCFATALTRAEVLEVNFFEIAKSSPESPTRGGRDV